MMTLSKNQAIPLAQRMRPRSLQEFCGQHHLLGEHAGFRQLAEQGKIGSCILWGPPGSGKTSLAFLLAEISKARFYELSAVSAGIKEIKAILGQLKKEPQEQPVILFIDEIHRFNKLQQDAVLPPVEQGIITLIGATTENPGLEINPALRSRCQTFQLQKLQEQDIQRLLKTALTDTVRGLGSGNWQLSEQAETRLVRFAAGDGRAALNLLEVAAQITPPGTEITETTLHSIIQKSAVQYDKKGDEHYNHASAYQKSMRGSDPDAALYWLGKMVAGGEAVTFISRRLVVTAAEDVGNADPQALVVAESAAAAAQRLGWPEARIPLAQATIYVATAPKSNAAIQAIDRVLQRIEKEGANYPVPEHLRDSHYAAAEQLKQGVGYQFPHDYPHHFVAQEYLPPLLQGEIYYQPVEVGFEREIKKRLQWWQKKRLESDC